MSTRRFSSERASFTHAADVIWNRDLESQFGNTIQPNDCAQTIVRRIIRTVPFVSSEDGAMHPSATLLYVFATCFAMTATAAEKDNTDVASIKSIMRAQQTAWNAGDVDEFMVGYWKSKELTFSSGGKTVRGWQATLDRYRERYPDKSTMGTLTFSDLEVTLLGDNAAFVLGRWQLKRKEPIGGNFSLVWRKIDGKWRIVHDHSSALEKK